MERKPLGRSGYEVSAIGLGCVTFGREIDEDASYRLLDYAMEKGITLFDTAEIYGGAQSRLDRAEYPGEGDLHWWRQRLIPENQHQMLGQMTAQVDLLLLIKR